MHDTPATPRKTLKLKGNSAPAPAELPPATEASADDINSAPEAGPASTAPVALPGAVDTPSWTEADEANLRTLLARRKAAGYQTRGRDVGSQLVKASDMHPNPGTIAATIIGLVEAKGTLPRAELVTLMAETPFPQPKAKPQDQGWCQGYVAGAIRNGFLTIVNVAPERSGEAC